MSLYTSQEHARTLPWRRIVARQEFDYEVEPGVYHAVWITLDCGHKEALGPSEWGVKVKRRCWQCGPVRPLVRGWGEGWR